MTNIDHTTSTIDIQLVRYCCIQSSESSKYQKSVVFPNNSIFDGNRRKISSKAHLNYSTLQLLTKVSCFCDIKIKSLSNFFKIRGHQTTRWQQHGYFGMQPSQANLILFFAHLPSFLTPSKLISMKKIFSLHPTSTHSIC